MTQSTEDVHSNNYTLRARKSLIVNVDGQAITNNNPLPVSSGGGFSDYEATLLAPGSSATSYSAKIDGSMFATVTTSYRTIITNNDSSEDIVVRLNLDTNGEITIAAGTTFELNNLPITDIFIDTTAGQIGTVEVVILG